MLGLSFVLCVAIEITYTDEVNGEDSINESLSTERGICSESISWFVTTNGREILDQALQLVTRHVCDVWTTDESLMVDPIDEELVWICS